MTNTTISYEGATYQLIDDAYLTNYQGWAVYETTAIIPGDEVDDMGYRPCYRIRWEILPEYSDRDDWSDESNACDWDEPGEVEECGGYNVATGWHC